MILTVALVPLYLTVLLTGLAIVGVQYAALGLVRR